MKKAILGMLLVVVLAVSANAQRGDSIVLYGDGFHDDTGALEAWNQGVPVWDRKFKKQHGNVLQNMNFLVDGSRIKLDDRTKTIRNCVFIVKYPNRYAYGWTAFWQVRNYGNSYLYFTRWGRYVSARKTAFE